MTLQDFPIVKRLTDNSNREVGHQLVSEVKSEY